MSPEGQLFGSKLGLALWDTLHKGDYVHLVGMDLASSKGGSTKRGSLGEG